MIFVTVGLHTQPFDRLIKKMDQIAERIDERIIMQIGISNYRPKNTDFFSFAENNEDLLEYFKSARIVITHGGAGTILDLLMLNKSMIIVPRLKKYQEHYDDQQIELAYKLQEKERALCITDMDKLETNILNYKIIQKKIHEGDNSLITFLKYYLMNLDS